MHLIADSLVIIIHAMQPLHGACTCGQHGKLITGTVWRFVRCPKFASMRDKSIKWVLLVSFLYGLLSFVFARFQHATDAAYEKYRCPVFKGFVVCVSGMASEDRNSVRRLVEQNGQCSTLVYLCWFCPAISDIRPINEVILCWAQCLQCIDTVG